MSLSGGFISFTGQQPKEPALDLQIDLPHEDPIIVRAEMVYRHQFGLAVRFVDLAPDTHARLTRVVEASTGKS
jgi:hypothetical protein